MPYDWRTEADPPSAYCTDGPATTVFMCYEHVFDGVQNAIITTYAFNANAVRQIISAWNDEPLRYRLGTLTGWWTDWVTLATATPPVEYDLPLAEGVTANWALKYFKTQDNVVSIIGSVGGVLRDGTVIGALPIGYRPAVAYQTCGALNTCNACVVHISTNGQLRVAFAGTETAQYLYYQASFVAVS